MKADVMMMNHDLHQQQHEQSPNNKQPSYFLWEQHNITLYKSPNCGYGLAISGGCNTSSLDSSVYVSDVVAGGPAESKLLPNDIILTVNGVNVENVEHEFVIRLLKEAKDFIHLVVKRKVVNSSETTTTTTSDQSNNSVVESQKYRQNLAIQQTAATVMANYVNSYQQQQQHTPNNPMSNMINSATSVSSLKPFKLTFTRSGKDKKEPYGVILGCKYYVKEILPNSVASHETSGLKLGDVVLKVNDFDVEHISLLDANRILTKTKENKIHLVVKRPSSNNNNLIESGSEADNIDSIDAVQSNKNYQNVESQVEQQQQTQPPIPPPSLPPSLPPTSQSSSAAMMKQLFKHIKQDTSGDLKSSQFPAMSPSEIRTVVFTRENSIGVRLAGGNRAGIFICDVQYNTRAERAGLRQADKILRVNGVDYSQLTREEAVKHLLSLSSLIEMVVVNARDEYESRALDPIGGDSFFVRTHFNYDASSDSSQLSFRINDVLHVTDTLHNGVIGQWVATRLNTKSFGEDQTNFEEEMRGTVPNHENAEQLISAAPTIDQQIAMDNNNQIESNSTSNGQNGAFTSLGASARMSIRKRLAGSKNGGGGTLAKRSRSASRVNNNGGLEIEHNTNIKVSKANTYLSNKFSAYERVVHREVNFPRPIVIFGPLADVAREKLKNELPDRFEIPESFSTNPTDQQQSATGVIKLASIKAIIEKGKHSLLDITPNAVDHLNYAQYFPIVVYLKAQSRAHTKELRAKYAKNLRAKSSRRLHDNSTKLESFYSHLFTAVLTLDSSQWFKKLKETIESQQSQIVWISHDLDKFLTQNEKEEEQQQQREMDKQQQLHQPNDMYNHNDLIFNDNFEFQTFGTLGGVARGGGGGASSTYSLYEDSNNYNRSSFAASDSDIATSNMMMMSPYQQQQQQQMTSIYSTNFKTKSINNCVELPRPQNGPPPPLPTTSHKVNNSDPNLLSRHPYDEQETMLYNQGGGVAVFTPNTSQQMKQHLYNSYEVNNSHVSPLHQHHHLIDNANSDNSWRKFATYSANSLRHLTSKLLNNPDQQLSSDSESRRKRPSPPMSHNSGVVMSISAPSSVVKSSSTNRQFMNDQVDHMYQQKSDNYYTSQGLVDEQQQPASSMRNSSLSNYIQLKNAQQPMMMKQISTGSLLLPTNLVQSNNNGDSMAQQQRLETRMSELKLSNNNDLYTNHQLMTHAKSNNSIVKPSTTTTTNSMTMMKRKKESNSSSSTFSANKPPPTLPKPKFILPQSSTTSMILQRNLKAKSELNIATTPSTTTFASTCSSSSSSTTSSNSPEIKNEPTTTMTTSQQLSKRSVSSSHQQSQQQQQQPAPLPPPPPGLVQSIRNKFLENSSVVSSSQGYHSDAWESSQSSRQSFDMLMMATTVTDNPMKNGHQKSNKCESKLAKTTILKNGNVGVGSHHDALVSSSSEDNESSMPTTISDPPMAVGMGNNNGGGMHQYYNVQTKSIMIQKPPTPIAGTSSAAASSSQLFHHQLPTTSSSSTVSTTSSSGGAGSSGSSSSSSSSTSSTNCFNNSPNISSKLVSSSNGGGESIELPIYYQPSNNNGDNQTTTTNNRYSDLYSNEAVKFKVNTYGAHYNDNGVYRKLMLDSNSNCSIIASANGIFDTNGGILESADTGVSLNVPEGAIAPGCEFDLYFKVCHCKSSLTNSKGEPLTNPIVMCGPRGIRFLKPVELQIPHFISLDGKSWSYAFKTSETGSNNESDDPTNNWSRFYKRTLINSVTVMLDSF